MLPVVAVIVPENVPEAPVISPLKYPEPNSTFPSPSICQPVDPVLKFFDLIA